MVLVFSRFYNLERTAKINRDEAADLMKIHQYWVEKKISLIGPISEDGNMVYSALTYYLVMPFAVLGNFKAVSPAWGAAFWGVVAVVLLLLIINKRNKKIVGLVFILLLVLFPLVETGRWCWNPNFIPFWLALGFYLYGFDRRMTMLLSGLAMGMAVHHHYLGLIPVVGWGLVTIIDYWKKDKIKIIFFAAGAILPLLVFAAFDLTHPPGLFITRAMYFNRTQKSLNLSVLEIFMSYLFRDEWAVYIGGFLCGLLLFIDGIKWEKLKYFLPILLQSIVNLFIGDLQAHYFIASVIFYLLWLLAPRKKSAELTQIVLIIFLIIVNIAPTLSKIFVTQYDNAYMIDKIANVITDDIRSGQLINANVAVLQSEDINSIGLKYRDMLRLRNQKILSQDEYGISDNLYVISTGDEASLRNDPSTQMQIFKNGVLKNKWEIQGTNWIVYRFDRY